MTKEKIRKQGDVIFIGWVDSCTTFGWQHSSDCKSKTLYCQSVGFFVDENDDCICIALNRSISEGFNPFGDLIDIPKCSIKEMRSL